jgi:hypothetical protein
VVGVKAWLLLLLLLSERAVAVLWRQTHLRHQQRSDGGHELDRPTGTLCSIAAAMRLSTTCLLTPRTHNFRHQSVDAGAQPLDLSGDVEWRAASDPALLHEARQFAALVVRGRWAVQGGAGAEEHCRQRRDERDLVDEQLGGHHFALVHGDAELRVPVPQPPRPHSTNPPISDILSQ